MARFNGVTPDEMNDKQREVADAIISGGRGRAAGLMGLWLHHPEMTEYTQRVGEYLRFKAKLPGNIREMVILLVARDWRCYHEWLVHVPIAIKHGLSEDHVEAIRDLKVPNFEDDDERAVYNYVSELLKDRRVTDASFNDVRNRFGIPGVIELAGIVGHYIIGAATLNAAEFDLPEGTAAPF